MRVKIRKADMRGRKLLRSSRFLEPELLSLLFSGRAVGPFHGVVAARSGHHLAVLNAVEDNKGSNAALSL